MFHHVLDGPLEHPAERHTLLELFAPYKGTETQQIISGKVKLALDKATELYESNEHDGAYSNDAKKRSQEIIDTARDEAKKILNEANSIIKEIKGYPKTHEN